jgi:hypothetical protein
MKTKEQIWARVERDQVLNLVELAVASRYPRSALGAMRLPLTVGKISLSDFKRILRQRQDQRENLHAAPAASSPDFAINDRQRRPASAIRAMRYPKTPTAEDLFFGNKRVNNNR